MNTYPLRYSIAIIFLSCTSSDYKNQSTKYDSAQSISFCDLPKYEGQLVRTQFNFSRNQEYASIYDAKKSCDSALYFSFDFQDKKSVPGKFIKLLKKVNSNGPKYHLNIIAVGSFKKGRYGHLGSNNGLFIIAEIVEATLLKN